MVLFASKLLFCIFKDKGGEREENVSRKIHSDDYIL